MTAAAPTSGQYTAKKVNPLFAERYCKSLIAKNPTTAAVTEPTAMGAYSSAPAPEEKRSGSFVTQAPSIAGSESRNENLTAYSRV